jgi:hypothetical protein
VVGLWRERRRMGRKEVPVADKKLVAMAEQGPQRGKTGQADCSQWHSLFFTSGGNARCTQIAVSGTVLL